MSEDDVIVETLRGRIAHHQSELDSYQAKVYEHRAALDRYTASLSALLGRGDAGTDPNRANVGDPNGTVETMKRVLQAAQGPLSMTEIINRMALDGWVTTSKVPYNTARTAIGRMVENKLVVRTPSGEYRIATDTDTLLAQIDEQSA